MQPKNSDNTIKNMVDSTANVLCNLYERWQDEKEYEDFADYAKVMKESAEKTPGIKFLKGTKRPFGFNFTYNKVRYELGVRAKGNRLSIECKRLGVSPA